MADEAFSQDYRVNWNDLDPNFHLRAAVWVDYAVNTQYLWLEQHGINQARYKELGYEPIALRLEAQYRHEATFGDTIRDTPLIDALSIDGSRWRVRHNYLKNGKERAGSIILEGTWLDWETRQAVAPAPDILQALNKLPRTPNYEELKSFMRGKKGTETTQYKESN